MMILRVSHASFLRGGFGLVALRRLGFSAEHAETGQDALEYLRLYDYDVIMIDMHLPGMSGQDVVRMIRGAGFTTPVLILTACATATQKAEALDQGADDVILIPCETEELLARMRAVVRRSQGHANSALRRGNVELSLDRREVRVDGAKLSLTRREFAILELLFLKQDVILNKTAFMNHLYCGTVEPEIKSIDVAICRVRKKLSAAGVPDLIDTVWGCGYILRDLVAQPSPPPDTHVNGHAGVILSKPAASRAFVAAERVDA